MSARNVAATRMIRHRQELEMVRLLALLAEKIPDPEPPAPTNPMFEWTFRAKKVQHHAYNSPVYFTDERQILVTAPTEAAALEKIKAALADHGYWLVSMREVKP